MCCEASSSLNPQNKAGWTHVKEAGLARDPELMAQPLITHPLGSVSLVVEHLLGLIFDS